jgi:ribonuclease P/MRP protein subunit RPP1
MKKPYDLHLRVPLDDVGLAEKMIGKASTLGYAGIGISLPTSASIAMISKLQQICSDAEVDFVARVDFAPKSAHELLMQLRRFRRKFEIISVACLSKSVARQAAKDRRVDLVSFPSHDFKQRFFDVAEATLAANSLACLEIDTGFVISATSFERIRLFSYLRRELEIAEKFSVPVIISSGVTNELLMRTPRDLAAFCCLFDMPLAKALDAISKNPSAIVERNRAKMTPDYVAPGIRVVRRGKDC